WFFFSSRRRHTRFSRDWSSDVCSSDLHGDHQLRQVVQQRDQLVPVQTSLDSLAQGLRLFPLRLALLQIVEQTEQHRLHTFGDGRSEERRVGKEGRRRWSTLHGAKTAIR